MATFNDLAVELQEAIWEFVLPHRGIHWFQVEGILQPAPYIRDSIRFTKMYNFGEFTPQSTEEIYRHIFKVPEYMARAQLKFDNTGGFFRQLLTTVPSVWGLSGPQPGDELPQEDQDQEIAYTRRCRQLSSYTQIAVLLSTCRLSRLVAQRRTDDTEYNWYLFRGMGPLHRPRPMRVWEDQYCGTGDGQAPLEVEPDRRAVVAAAGGTREWELLLPKIDFLDIAVFRLHDSQGRPTHMLRHGPWQYDITHGMHKTTYANFDRLGIEWHPRWATPEGREDFCEYNVKAFVELMSSRLPVSHEIHLYWLVDGIPRPDWKHDYPAAVEAFFEGVMTVNPNETPGFLGTRPGIDDEERARLAELHLHQEFEANGRRYYIVFVVVRDGRSNPAEHELERQLSDAGLGRLGPYGPFPGGEDMWPEALRAPAWFAWHVGNRTANLYTHRRFCFILSWEPI